MRSFISSQCRDLRNRGDVRRLSMFVLDLLMVQIFVTKIPGVRHQPN